MYVRSINDRVMEMQPVLIPEFPKLRGEEAIEVLHNFIREFEEQGGKELTTKQTNALTKFSLGLISSIEAEKRLNRTMNRSAKQTGGETLSFTRLKKKLQNTFLRTNSFKTQTS